jgi:uncharacterized protein (TIGR03067 family)
MRATPILVLGTALAVVSQAFGQAPKSTPGQPNPDRPPLPGQRPVLPPTPAARTPAELPKVSGDWVIIGGERDGQRIPEERIQGLRVTITADTITVMGRDQKPLFVAAYTLNTAKTRTEIDMKIVEGPTKGQVAQGIVDQESADRMRLCYSPGAQGRPRDFSTRPGGTNGFLFLLGRASGGPVSGQMLAGTWAVSSGVVDGKKIPADRVRDARVIITADTINLVDPDKKTWVMTYSIDNSQVPQVMALKIADGPHKGRTALGILELQSADRLVLRYVVGAEQPPRGFASEPGGAQDFAFVLDRVRGTGVPAPDANVPTGPPPVPPNRPDGR